METGFKNDVDNRKHCVGVVGLGYVGLPLIHAAVEHGFTTIGFDIDQKKVDLLLAGKTYIKTVGEEIIQGMVDSGRFDSTTDFSLLEKTDSILICVPTPLTQHREPDMSYIVSTAEALFPHLHEGHVIVLESTTYPGTTDEVLRPILEKSGLVAGKNMYLAYSPEREDPGNKHFTTSTIPKVIGADDTEGRERATYLYEQIFDTIVPVTSTRVAEAVKLSENIFRSVNIALVNELKDVYAKMGINVWEVIDAAKTKPFGFMPFYPGPGLGGHCIPIDPFYLTWKAREFGKATRFIEIAGEINTAMPAYVIDQLMNALNEHSKALKNSKVLLIGVAYKPDIDDLRESPSLALLDLLFEKGAKVDYYDPYIPSLPHTRKHPKYEGMKSIDLTPEAVQSYDAVLISTNHSAIDYNELVENAQLVVDTRNATKDVTIGKDKIFFA